MTMGNLVVGKNGVFRKQEDVLANCTFKFSADDLPEIEERIAFKVPKIPAWLLKKALNFLRFAYEKHQSEGILLFKFHDGKWDVVCPIQYCTGGGAHYKLDELPPVEQWGIVGTIHSHPKFGSSTPSCTDERDEVAFTGVHMVVRDFTLMTCDPTITYVPAEGKRIKMTIESVIDEMESTGDSSVPDLWKERFHHGEAPWNKKYDLPKQYSLGEYGGYSGYRGWSLSDDKDKDKDKEEKEKDSRGFGWDAEHFVAFIEKNFGVGRGKFVRWVMGIYGKDVTLRDVWKETDISDEVDMDTLDLVSNFVDAAEDFRAVAPEVELAQCPHCDVGIRYVTCGSCKKDIDDMELIKSVGNRLETAALLELEKEEKEEDKLEEKRTRITGFERDRRDIREQDPGYPFTESLEGQMGPLGDPPGPDDIGGLE